MLNNYLYDFLSHVFRKDNAFSHVLYVHFRTLFVRMRTRNDFVRFSYLVHNQRVIRMARFLGIKIR